MTSFVYDALPGRVRFGVTASCALPEEVDRLGAGRVLVVAGRDEKAIADELVAPLGARVVGRFEDVVQHVPVAQAEAAVARAREVRADTILTIGGGSATGFGKAISLQVDVKHLAVPTTYAGSEMTPIWGMTRDGRKETGRDPRVQPDTVVYDPRLTLALPPEIAGPSGMNALAHAVEALYAPGANPVMQALALDATRRLHRSLPRVVRAPDDLEARTEALLGAYLAACTLRWRAPRSTTRPATCSGGMFDLGARRDERGDAAARRGLQRASDAAP